MIINSFSLAIGIVAALLALIFCGMAIGGALRDRRARSGGIVARLEADRLERERQRTTQPSF